MIDSDVPLHVLCQGILIMSDEQNTMLQVTGLWINEAQSGEKYMVGYLGSLRVLIFKNRYKTDDRHPDYVMHFAPKAIVTTEQNDEPPF